MLKHGPKLLTHAEEETQRFIKDLITQILSVNNSAGMNYKYEKLITIYINQERLLEELLDFILIKDEDHCSNAIIHR